jgi:SAM-dependent methyltransferase
MNPACHVCGGSDFAGRNVLWEDLIRQWQLAPDEAAYIDRQQGLHCRRCGNNLRSMALALAIVRACGFRGTLAELSVSPGAEKLRILEINNAGGLTPVLQRFPGHRLVAYPQFDMMALDIPDRSFDLVVHSDTLEHVEQPVTGLAECRRVLDRGGRCLFTVPVVVGRLSRSRAGLEPSCHNAPGAGDDLRVHTEFGADMWCYALRAGFDAVTVHAAEYPAGLAIEARVEAL